MHSVLRRLLGEAIDYAGVFPPAQLGLAEAVDNYRAYRNGPEYWLVGRLVVRSRELEELSELIEEGDEFSLAVIAQPGNWSEGREFDAKTMSEFQDRFGDDIPIENYEVRLPPGGFNNVVKDLQGFSEADVYVELPWDSAIADTLAAIAETEWLNAKARTGGETVPSASRLAEFLLETLNLQIPFKLTAGLHEPIAHKGAHGFLNVLGGCAVAFGTELSKSELERILMIEDPRAFAVEDSGLAVGEWSADIAALEETRDYFMGFGSCSIEEPLAGLARAGLA